MRMVPSSHDSETTVVSGFCAGSEASPVGTTVTLTPSSTVSTRLTTSGETPVHGSTSSSTKSRCDGSRAATLRAFAHANMAAESPRCHLERCRAGTALDYHSVSRARRTCERTSTVVPAGRGAILLGAFAGSVLLAGERPCFDLACERVFRQRAARRERAHLGEALRGFRGIAQSDERSAEVEGGDGCARVAAELCEDALEEGHGLAGMARETTCVVGDDQLFGVAQLACGERAQRCIRLAV